MQYWFLSLNYLFRNIAKRFGLAVLVMFYSLNVLAFDAGGLHPVKSSDEVGSSHHPKFDRITDMDDLMTRLPVPNVNVRGIGILVFVI